MTVEFIISGNVFGSDGANMIMKSACVENKTTGKEFGGYNYSKGISTPEPLGVLKQTLLTTD